MRNLSIILALLVLISCNSKTEKKESDLTKAKSEEVKEIEKPNTPPETEQIEDDTLSVQDRRLADGNFHSHIKLEFAQVFTEVTELNQISIFDTVCAVAVIPDTTWINKQQDEMGDDWNEVVSDNQYYEYIARETLDNHNIQSFFAPREKQYVKFIKSDNTSFILDLTKMEDAWGLILFNGKDNPVLWSSTDIDSELKEIYKK